MNRQIYVIWEIALASSLLHIIAKMFRKSIHESRRNNWIYFSKLAKKWDDLRFLRVKDNVNSTNEISLLLKIPF